ncbi:MAG: Rab family GTPase [Candidatus Sigynarchaeota archaeon]
MSTSKRSYIFKTVILGDGAVGKTSLVMMFTEQKFQNQYIMTIGSNFALKLIPGEILTTGEKEYPDVRLQLWDLAGQPHFRAVRHPFYKGASGIIYVFDVTRPDTLEHLLGWREELFKQVPPTTPAILLANKVDLKNERKVSTNEGRAFMTKLGAKEYFETSAKDGVNVNIGFQVLARMIVDVLPPED